MQRRSLLSIPSPPSRVLHPHLLSRHPLLPSPSSVLLPPLVNLLVEDYVGARARLLPSRILLPLLPFCFSFPPLSSFYFLSTSPTSAGTSRRSPLGLFLTARAHAATGPARCIPGRPPPRTTGTTTMMPTSLRRAPQPSPGTASAMTGTQRTPSTSKTESSPRAPFPPERVRRAHPARVLLFAGGAERPSRLAGLDELVGRVTLPLGAGGEEVRTRQVVVWCAINWFAPYLLQIVTRVALPGSPIKLSIRIYVTYLYTWTRRPRSRVG
ncbi:hypothetical protein DFH09DRAFT_1316665 [Mycena vulgaris]|nr:hypothetical protein DFH09DRAFT_1316665 [Mycena vulgaris]